MVRNTTRTIEQPSPLTSESAIELGDTFTDPAVRNLFSRHKNTIAVANHSFSDVVLDPITTIVLQDRVPVHCGGYLHSGELDGAIRRLELPPDHRLQERRVFMGYTQFDNYYHWMMECIPAIANYQMDPEFANGMLLLPNARNFPHYVLPAIRLATCFRQLPDIFLAGRQQLPIRQLVFSSFLHPQSGPSRFANKIFDRMVSHIKKSTGLPHRRLYVSREDAPGRPIANENALIALMIRHGIEPVVPGRLSQADQISTFHDANLIIGTHGAGLTNTVFMQPGSLLYELFPSYLVNPCFNFVCQGRGIHYLADVFSCPAPLRPGFEGYRNLPWEIDLGVVERRLAAINRNFQRQTSPVLTPAGADILY